MKNYVFLLSLLFFLSGFSVTVTSPDEKDSMATLDGFYDAMSKFEYEKIGDFCASDFNAIDNGKYFKNIDEFLELLHTFEGATFEIELELKDSNFDSKNGLLIVMFDVDINMNNEKMHITAIESYLMKKVKGKWLIDFIHSTPITN